MPIKEIVKDILDKKKRPLSWLANKMGKTFDGLKYSLNNESIKYKDMVSMAKILEVSPALFFKPEVSEAPEKIPVPDLESAGLKMRSGTQQELINTLKDQIKDKDRIIAMLDNGIKVPQ